MAEVIEWSAAQLAALYISHQRGHSLPLEVTEMMVRAGYETELAEQFNTEDWDKCR